MDENKEDIRTDLTENTGETREIEGTRSNMEKNDNSLSATKVSPKMVFCALTNNGFRRPS